MEQWKEIPGYENYQVSDLGRVENKFGNILSPRNNRGGYIRYYLTNNIGSNNLSSHRLVMLAFIGKSKLEVNHIDGNKLNNHISNLEYCTRSHNIKEAIRTGLMKPQMLGKLGKEHPTSKIIYQYTIEGEYINMFHGSCEASRITGVQRSSISKCSIGKQKKAGGYIFTDKKKTRN